MSLKYVAVTWLWRATSCSGVRGGGLGGGGTGGGGDGGGAEGGEGGGDGGGGSGGGGDGVGQGPSCIHSKMYSCCRSAPSMSDSLYMLEWTPTVLALERTTRTRSRKPGLSMFGSRNAHETLEFVSELYEQKGALPLTHWWSATAATSYAPHWSWIAQSNEKMVIAFHQAPFGHVMPILTRSVKASPSGRRRILKLMRSSPREPSEPGST